MTGTGCWCSNMGVDGAWHRLVRRPYERGILQSPVPIQSHAMLQAISFKDTRIGWSNTTSHTATMVFAFFLALKHHLDPGSYVDRFHIIRPKTHAASSALTLTAINGLLNTLMTEQMETFCNHNLNTQEKIVKYLNSVLVNQHRKKTKKSHQKQSQGLYKHMWNEMIVDSRGLLPPFVGHGRCCTSVSPYILLLLV